MKFLLPGLIFFIIACSNSDEYAMQLKLERFPSRTQDFSMWQLEPFFHEPQMGYIIKTDDNKVIVVDSGGTVAAPFLESYIDQLGGIVHTWIITHAHMDHIGAFLSILENDKIQIEELFHAPPSKDWVLKNEPISSEIFDNYTTKIQEANISTTIPDKNSEYTLGEGVKMKVLSAGNFDIAENALNNSSLVFKIWSKSKSVLFLGDMGEEGGQKILQTTDFADLKSDYVQMAHHGQHGVNKEFYKAVAAKYALWPTPEWLWNNRADGEGYNTAKYKTIEVREWMEELGAKNYVSGLEGTIQID